MVLKKWVDSSTPAALSQVCPALTRTSSACDKYGCSALFWLPDPCSRRVAPEDDFEFVAKVLRQLCKSQCFGGLTECLQVLSFGCTMTSLRPRHRQHAHLVDCISLKQLLQSLSTNASTALAPRLSRWNARPLYPPRSTTSRSVSITEHPSRSGNFLRRIPEIRTILSQEIHEGNTSEIDASCRKVAIPSSFFPFVLHDGPLQPLGILIQAHITQKLVPKIPTGFQLQASVRPPENLLSFFVSSRPHPMNPCSMRSHQDFTQFRSVINARCWRDVKSSREQHLSRQPPC